MASRKPPSPNPYAKAASAPLPPPQTDSAVNYVQIPENIMWLSGSRGFMKRPGSLPAVSLGDSSSAVRLCGLFTIRTPAAVLNGSPSVNTQGKMRDAVTVLALRKAVAGETQTDGPSQISPVAEIRKVEIFDALDKYFFTRDLTDRDETRYGFVDSYNSQTLSEYSDLIYSLSFPSATYTQFGQQLYQICTIPTEPTTQARSITSSTKTYTTLMTNKVYVPFAASDAVTQYVPAFNTGRVDAAIFSDGTYVGGAGGSILYFDGFRAFRAGAISFSSDLGGTGPSTSLAAGSLTGDYQYMYTHVVYLQSGEIIEGEPSPATSVSPSAQQVTVTSWPSGAGVGAGYNCDSYISNDAVAAASSCTLYPTNLAGTLVDAPIQVRPGQKIYFVQGGVVAARTVATVSGTNTVTFTSSLPYNGPVHASLGGTWRLYRTKAGGDVFYKLTEVSCQSGTTSYVDNTADNSLTTTYTETATTRYGAPIRTHSIVGHQGRLFALVTDTSSRGTINSTSTTFCGATVMYTSALSRHYFPIENTFELPENAGKPRALISTDDVLYIFTDRKVFYVTGTFDDASTYTVRLLTSKYGCRDPRSVIAFGDSVLFMSDVGLMEINGTTVRSDIGKAIESLVGRTDVVTAMYAWKSLLLLAVCPKFHSETYQTGTTATRYNGELDATNDVSAKVLTTSNAYTLVYNSEAQRWSKWDINCFNGACELDGDLLFAGGEDPDATTVTVRRLNENNNWTDTGVPFTARYYSEWYDAGVPSVDKSFDRAQVFSTDTSEAGGQGFKLTVRTERDWQQGLTVDEFTDLTDFKVDYGYGEQPYGSQPYGDPELAQKVLPLSNQRCKSLRLVLENSEPNRNFCINGVAVEINPKFVNMKDE